MSSLEESNWRRRAIVETDSYVIIPAATAFHELVPAAMMRLGYPHELAASAKGNLEFNNKINKSTILNFRFGTEPAVLT